MTADYTVGYYCQKYFNDSQSLQTYGCPYWPMLNFGPNDSLLRFPAYAALAYGAKGIWYYTYGGPAGACYLQDFGTWSTTNEVNSHLTEQYPVAQAVNNQISSWSPWVMDRSSSGLFGSIPSTRGPVCDKAYPVPTNNGLAAPASYKLVQAAPDHIVIGILTKPGAFPLAMVVNGLTSTNFGDLPNRSVTIQFTPQVSTIDIIQGGTNIVHSNGSSITLNLEPGGGQLLQLEGSQLDVMTTPSAIYASSPPLERVLKMVISC